MREDQQQFMRVLGQLPARLTAEQAAWVLNCQKSDVPILVAVRLLKPLGNPPPHSVKFFAASELLEQVQDRAWLAKITNALNQHWQKRKQIRKIVWRKVWLAQIDGWLGFDYLNDLFTRLPAAKITEIKQFTSATWVKTKAEPVFVQKAGASLPGKQNLL